MEEINKKDAYEQAFTKSIIQAGRVTLLLAIPLSFLPVYQEILPICGYPVPLWPKMPWDIVAIAAGLFLLGVVKVLPVWLVIPICIFSTIIFAINTYKRKKRKA